MPRWLVISFTVALLYVQCSVNAASFFSLGDIYFHSIGKKETFEGGVITAMVQDQQGFIWIGTYNGLLRYDGYRFNQFNHDPNDKNSLSGNYIRTLALGKNGHIWIGTFADGLSVYDAKSNQFTNYRHIDDDDDSLANNRIDSIACQSTKICWIGTDKGLDRLDIDTGKFSHFRHLTGNPDSINDNHIRALLIDKHDRLWIGSWNGLNRLTDATGKFDNMFSDKREILSLEGKKVSRIFQDNDNNYWFGTFGSGVYRLTNNGQFERVPLTNANHSSNKKTSIRAIAQTLDGHIWIATYGNGIFELANDTAMVTGHFVNDPTIDSSINHNRVATLLRDRSGLMWVGTWGGGLNQVNPTNNAVRTLHHSNTKPNTLSYSEIGPSLALKNGQIWVGTRGNGIDIIDPNIGVVDGIRPSPNGLVGGTIKALAESADGSIWIGTINAGMFQYQPANKQLIHYDKAQGLSDSTVRYILPSKSGKIWIATGAGLNQLDPNNGQISHFEETQSFQHNLTAAFEILAEQSDGTLWASANNGLYMLPPGNSQLIRLTHDDKDPATIAHDNTIGLLVDRQDQLWVASSGGLNLLQKIDGAKSRFQYINPLLGFDAGVVGENLLQDKQGRIWTGQVMFDPRTWQSIRLQTADGVDNDGGWLGAYGQTADDILLYGGNNGLMMIKPQNFKPWHYQPPLVISKLKIDGLVKPVPDELLLPPGSRTFSVEFSALDYSAPANNRYAYRLSGFETDWVEADAEYRVANYTNLDPGSYTLQIRGSNRLGQFSESQLQLKVVQLPSWFQTLWFRIITILTLLALIYGWLRWRLYSSVQKQTQLQQLVAARTEQFLEAKLAAESANLAKSNFLAAMSHEIRTPMNAVLGYAQLMQQDKTLGNSHIKTLGAIEKAGNHLMDVINDILDISKIEAGNAHCHNTDFDLDELIQQINTMSELRCHQKNIEWQLLNDIGSNNKVTGDASKLRQVLINLIGNAFKFTEKGGIILRVSKAQQLFRFEVIDTGPGMTKKEQKNIFEPFVQATSGHNKGGTGLGLSISLAHVTLMGGRISLDSEAGKGSHFTIEVPLPKATGAVSKTDQSKLTVQRIAANQPVIIMVVDDSDENRDILSRALQNIGAEVLQCRNTNQAIGPLSMLGRERQPQLIFLDTRLANKADIANFQQIRDKVGDRTKIVAMSASALDQRESDFLDLGFDHFITKPYRFEQVYDCLANLLGIEFEYQSTPSSNPKDGCQPVEQSPLPATIVAQLLAIAETYEISKLEAEIAALIASAPEYQFKLEQLSRHIDAYDIDAFIEELQGTPT